MTPLPPLDISSPEAARDARRQLDRCYRYDKDGLPFAVRTQVDFVYALLYVLLLPAAHESPALKHLVQEAIDKLRATLAGAAREDMPDD